MMLKFIKKLFTIRNCYCMDCYSEFPENRLVELHCGTEYVDAIVCPHCESKNWKYIKKEVKKQ